ncbi:OpgC domain-containing protein [Spirosoma flavum]|uniref:OpgC domain-containing protein n=1 Tax=Spirosoma flavum TaxID=2048557 RepID=A0ABW6AI59_9BACT
MKNQRKQFEPVVSQERNEQIDFFRGFLLVLMTINHFISGNNFLIRITREAIGWVEGAAGFVFLSGFTVGLIYTNKYLKKGEYYIRRTAFNRSWLIYKFHISAFILSLLAVLSLEVIKNHWGLYYSTMLEHPFVASILATGFLYQPKNLDILPMYALFLLPVPWIITYLHKNIKGHFLVLGISFLVYLIGTFQQIQLNYTWLSWGRWIDTGAFDILSWQFLFVMGLFLGYKSFKHELAFIFDRPPVLYSALILAGCLCILRNAISLHLIESTDFDIHFWADKKYLRPLRGINIAVIFILIRYLMVKFKDWFRYKPLIYLGKNSIEVFFFHLLLVLFLSPFNSCLNHLSSFHLFKQYYFFPLETLLTFAVVAALFLAPILWSKSSLYYQDVKSFFYKPVN